MEIKKEIIQKDEKSLNVKVSSELMQKINIKAKILNISLKDFVNRTLENATKDIGDLINGS